MNILVVDDHAVVRRGTMDIIADMPGPCSFTEAAGVAQALRALEGGTFDLAVLDISLPDGSGLDLLEHMTRERPGLPAIVLSMHQEAEYARRALSLGARGYLGKNSAPEELAEALAVVLDGGVYVSPSLSPRLADGKGRAGGLPGLSAREAEVARRLGAGEKLTDIARDMGISVKTASTYRSRGMRKLGVNTTAAIIRRVIETEGR
ncbi:MAG: response regulator [Thermodesulfobacteriota bacterium]